MSHSEPARIAACRSQASIQGCSDDQPNDPGPGNRKPLFAIRPDVRRDRTGRASRAAIDAARAGVHLHRPRHARARHRPQHRDFLRRLRRALASAAVSQSRSPHHRLVSAADRDGRQDVLDLAARDLRGAAPARHHARSSRGLHLHRRAAHRTRRAAAVARARRESEFLRHAGRQSRARPRVPHWRRGARRRSRRDRQRSAVAHVAQGRSGDRRTVHHHRRPPPYRRRRAAAGLHLQAGDHPARRAAGGGHLSAQSLARRHRRERVSLPAGPHEVRRDAGTRGSGIDGAGERAVDRARRRTRDGRRVRAERPHARAHGQLAGARHGVGASAAADPARGRVVRAADRLRQRREPADGAPHRAPRRTVRPHGPRRGTPADRAPVADRSGRVVAAGRGARA